MHRKFIDDISAIAPSKNPQHRPLRLRFLNGSLTKIFCAKSPVIKKLLYWKECGIVQKEMFLKKFRIGFDVWALVLFLIIMIPNFIWFTVPAPNDILREESVTVVVDMIAVVPVLIFTICHLIYAVVNYCV